MNVVVVQTYVPEFRVPLFNDLYARTGGNFSVWSGKSYFTPTAESTAESFPWHRIVRNRFVIHRSLLWQKDHLAFTIPADLCIVEFNPRIVSTWVLLIVRRLTGRRTILWGHLYPRVGRRSATKWIRFVMLLVAGGINTYTFTEAKLVRELRSRFPLLFRNIYLNVSPNAIMWSRDCHYRRENPMKRHRILVVGRLIKDKQPEVALQGFIAALPRLPNDIVLDIVGAGPVEGRLQQIIAEANVPGRISLHGEIYNVDRLRKLYDEAILSISAGYVGLSATQTFGFGVPMLIVTEVPHSVEIELCEEGFNCTFYHASEPKQLTDLLVGFVCRPPAWSRKNEEISRRVREHYTLERMSDGFYAMFTDLVLGSPRCELRKLVIAVAWSGLPHYAARSVAEAIRRHPEFQFVIISSRDHVESDSAEKTLGQRVHWIASTMRVRWGELGEPIPDVFILTSWPHVAYQSLATEAKQAKGACIVSMVDNYFRGTPKQIAGLFYFRLVLRDLYDAMWVPGEYSRRFMRILGAAKDNIFLGLYAGDGDIFYPPAEDATRNGIVFAGQLIKRKGIDRLAAALSARGSANGNLRVRVVGAGEMASAINVRGIVVEPFQPPAALAEIFRSASALILPSVLDHWGVVIHEAALCGCLLLVTKNCGASAELVQHRINGYVMRKSSESEILAAFQWLEGLTEAEIRRGRQVSIARARTISPAGWADTLDFIVSRYFG